MSNSDNDNKYPDILAPDQPPEGYRKLGKVEGRKKVAPKIKWGDDFLAWSDREKVAWLKKFSSSMNHAADLLQKERNKLVETCAVQDEKLKQHAKEYLHRGQMLHKQVIIMNSEKQELNKMIVELQQRVKTQDKVIHRLNEKLAVNAD